MFNRKEILRGVLAVAIIIVGITHFAKPDPYVTIVPPQLPNTLTLQIQGTDQTVKFNRPLA
jgi:uncharacterized membrane protein